MSYTTLVILKGIMKESIPNFQLSDRDFASYLRSLKSPLEIIKLGKQWFFENGKPISEGLDTVTTTLNSARSHLTNAVLAENADYNLNERDFAKYLRGLKDSDQIVFTGLNWFSQNGVGYGDALDLTTTIFNNLRDN